MAKGELGVRVEYILKLTREEAKWLTEILSNPLNGYSPSKEDSVDMKFRKSIWTALDSMR